jgi:hypothetical protein
MKKSQSQDTQAVIDPVAIEFARRAASRSIPRNDKTTLEIVMSSAKTSHSQPSKQRRQRAKS